MDKKNLASALIPLGVGLLIFLIPCPEGLAPVAWHYFAVFAAVIVGLILEPIPGSVIALLGISVAGVFQLIGDKPAATLKWALSGFSNSVIWLIFVAYMFGLGYEKTGLGRRISLNLIKLLGKKTLGIGYAVAFSELLLGPFMPSNTARSGGTIYPIVRNIPEIFDSRPGESARKMGAYLMWTGIAACAVVSSLFLTANAPNLLGLELVAKTLKITVSWRDWFLGILPIGLVLFLLMPLLTYCLYPPEIKESEGADRWAAEALAKMGKISLKELTMALLAVIALTLWIFADKQINATMVAIVIFVLMLLSKVVSWDDVLDYRQAWNMLIWFGALVALADGLKTCGFLTWFAAAVSGMMKGLPVMWIVILMVGIYFLVHYMFASLTAHATALMPVFLAAIAIVPEMPLKLTAMLLCYTSGFSCLLTPYASGPSVIYYGSGYIKRADFWRLGAIFGVIFLAALLLIEVPYLSWYLG